MDKRGKSEYTLRFSCTWQQVDNIITNWINANKFSLVEKKNKKYFVKGNMLMRRFFFEYSYNSNNQVTIITYCSNGKTWPIENEQLVSTGAGYDYLISIIGLLGAIYNMSSQYEQQPSVQTDYHRLAGIYYDASWQSRMNKKMRNFALLGMLIGIVGLILIAFGLVFGILILFAGLSFCIDGLRSDRKYMSYIGFVTIGISLVVWVIAMFNLFS